MRKEDMRFKVGWPGFWLKAYFSRREPKMAVWLACRGDHAAENYAALAAHKAEIERAVGQPLVWRNDEVRERRSLSWDTDGLDANDKEDWPRQHKLLADHIVRLYRAVQPVVEPMLSTQGAAGENVAHSETIL